MKNYILMGLLILTLASSADATNRRRSRRQRKAPTTYTQRATPQFSTSQATFTASSIITAPAIQASRVVPLGSPSTNGVLTLASASSQESRLPAADLLPTVMPTETPVPTKQSAAEIRTSTSVHRTSSSGAMSELNGLRAQRGLPGFVEDPSLTAIAYQKASIQAQRGASFHPGGSMGGARYEGVGMGAQFITCFAYSNIGTRAGAASVTGRDGRRYHCLLIR